MEEELTPEEAPPQVVVTKPKRQISDAQREHLKNIRAKALEKKAEMKKETLSKTSKNNRNKRIS
jgi:hypothetical protein